MAFFHPASLLHSRGGRASLRYDPAAPRTENVNFIARFGTQTGTGRLSTGEDGTGLQPYRMRWSSKRISRPPRSRTTAGCPCKAFTAAIGCEKWPTIHPFLPVPAPPRVSPPRVSPALSPAERSGGKPRPIGSCHGPGSVSGIPTKASPSAPDSAWSIVASRLHWIFT